MTSSSISYFHKDHLGSTAAVTGEDGLKKESTTYEPFGSTRTQEGTPVSSYKFTDQELDNETNLYNYDARLYDPVIGMFVTADSVVPRPYDPQSLNRYSYCRNNPIVFFDPSGHKEILAGTPGQQGIGSYSFSEYGEEVRAQREFSVNYDPKAKNDYNPTGAQISIGGTEFPSSEHVALANDVLSENEEKFDKDMEAIANKKDQKAQSIGKDIGIFLGDDPDKKAAAQAYARGLMSKAVSPTPDVPGIGPVNIPNAGPSVGSYIGDFFTDLFDRLTGQNKQEKSGPAVHPGSGHRSNDLDNLSGV